MPPRPPNKDENTSSKDGRRDDRQGRIGLQWHAGRRTAPNSWPEISMLGREVIQGFQAHLRLIHKGSARKNSDGKNASERTLRKLKAISPLSISSQDSLAISSNSSAILRPDSQRCKRRPARNTWSLTRVTGQRVSRQASILAPRLLDPCPGTAALGCVGLFTPRFTATL